VTKAKSTRTGARRPARGRSPKPKPPGRSRPAKPNQRWHGAIIADYAQLRHWPGVEYLGIGFKQVAGKLTRRRSVVIYVSDKGAFAEADRLPAKAKVLLPVGKEMYMARWLPTDVIKAHRASFAAGSVCAGADVGSNGEAATLGCLVQVSGDSSGAVFGLTAGHLFLTPPGQVNAGLVVTQPAPPDPSSARLGVTTSQPQGIAGNTVAGYVDWALVTHDDDRVVDPNTAVDPSFTFSKQILTEDELGSAGPLTVDKLGAPPPVGTGRRTGQFRAKLPSVPVGGVNCSQVWEFANPGGIMGAKGDSGALVVSRSGSTSGAVIGIVFGVSSSGESIFVFPLARVQPPLTMA
jgi:hypothetical protein